MEIEKDKQNIQQKIEKTKKERKETKNAFEELIKEGAKQYKELFMATELTKEEKEILKEILNGNITIESNIKFQGIIGNIGTIKLGNNGRSYKMFIPDGTSEYGLDLLIENYKKEFEEIENYFKENGINKPLKISLLFLLSSIITAPWKIEKLENKKNYSKPDFEKLKKDVQGNSAKLLFLLPQDEKNVNSLNQ